MEEEDKEVKEKEDQDMNRDGELIVEICVFIAHE